MFYLTTCLTVQDDKFFTIILKLCITCLNILKMGGWIGAMESVGKTLSLI